MKPQRDGWLERLAECDRRREAYEAELEEEAARLRNEHVQTVYVALTAYTSEFRGGIAGDQRRRAYAEIAVDALIASGVVFATIGSWDDEEDGDA